jgi:glycosyltransferase involved in cell wall biosynthesis
MHDRDRYDAVPVTFLVDDVFGGGGIARTVTNLANHLAEKHPVRVISYRQGRRRPRFPLSPSIRRTVLQKRNEEPGRIAEWLDSVPTVLRPRPTNMTLRTDRLLWRAIRSVRSGVLVTTRPSLHLAASRFARRGVATIAWDHMNFPHRTRIPGQLEVIRSARERLSGYVVLTERDADDHARMVPEAPAPTVIHNSFSWPVSETPAPLDSKVVVYAGRAPFRPPTGRLVRCFAEAAAGRPDWQLHLYGKGRKRAEVAALAASLGLEDQVKLMGYTRDLPGVLAGASAFAMASQSEGFPMVLIEAMSVGLPLIAFDCPRGPGEIIDHGSNGLLVPDGDLAAYTAGLADLMDDQELRRRLGAQGLTDAKDYTIDRIGARWEQLFDEMASRPRPRGGQSAALFGGTTSL